MDAAADGSQSKWATRSSHSSPSSSHVLIQCTVHGLGLPPPPGPRHCNAAEGLSYLVPVEAAQSTACMVCRFRGYKAGLAPPLLSHVEPTHVFHACRAAVQHLDSRGAEAVPMYGDWQSAGGGRRWCQVVVPGGGADGSLLRDVRIDSASHLLLCIVTGAGCAASWHCQICRRCQHEVDCMRPTLSGELLPGTRCWHERSHTRGRGVGSTAVQDTEM